MMPEPTLNQWFDVAVTALGTTSTIEPAGEWDLAGRPAVNRQTQQRAQADHAERTDIKVLTADDHQAFSDALRALILATPGFVLVGQASSGEEAVEAVDTIDPELVLMDIMMPVIGGVAATQAILSRYPNILVMLSP